MAATSFFANETLAVSTSAVGFTAATRGAANTAHVEVENATVRYLFGTPTATAGHILFPGDTLDLESADEVSRISFISRDGASASLSCSFGMH